MRPDFRMVVANGDLILEQKKRKGWWFGSDTEYTPYRNLSEEERLLKEHMDNAYMHYKQMQRLFVVAKKNIQTDKETLQMNQFDNSQTEFLIPSDFSILEERDGVKYNYSMGGGQNNGKGNNQQKQKQKQAQAKPMSIIDLLTSAKIVVPNKQQQAS